MNVNFLSHLWAMFLSLFSNLEHATKKLYDALPQADKDNLAHGSGFLAVINSMLDAAPDEVIIQLQAHFPDLDLKQTEAYANEIANALGFTTDGTLHSAIKILQNYLKNIAEGKIWSGISTGLALTLSLLFGSASEKAAVYTQLIGYVYKFIVRPKVMQTPAPEILDNPQPVAA